MMNSGKKFEYQIFKALEKINKQDEGFFIKTPTPIRIINKEKLGKKIIYHQKALCDFIGIFNGTFILIEAKSLFKESFEFRRLKQHQLQQLKAIDQYKGLGLIFFEFRDQKEIRYIRIKEMLALILKHQNKSIKIKELLNLTFKFELEKIGDLFNLLTN